MKERLDVLLVEQGFAASREKAKAIIMSGNVFVNGQREDKAGTTFDPAKSTIEVKGQTLKYVSRGELKLEKAMAQFDITLEDKVCMDIGASTGGFTDCMLQNGAKKVYAIDVGHNQLAKKLCEDNRVISIEGMNVRDITDKTLPEKVSFISVDISFISLKLAILPMLEILDESGKIAVLIKPQFEVGKENIGKGGIVKSKKAHIRMLDEMMAFFSECSLNIAYFSYSKIKGGDGNIEYIALLDKNNVKCFVNVEKTVDEAFLSLK